MTTKKRNFLNIFGLLLLLTIVITKTGCKKSDIYQIKNSKDPVIEKFFETKTVLNPTVDKVLQFLKNLDEKNNFITTFAKNEGFAIWDKAIVRTKNQIIGRITNSSEDTTVVIPLVIVNSNQVNNYLRAVINSDSILVSLYKGEDYKNRVFGTSVQPIGAAEEYAIKFMTLDNHVFGNKKSRILDKRLFAKGQIIPDTSTKPRYVEINVQENTNSRLYACVTTTLIYTSCGTPDYCGDNCDGATGNCPTGECTGWTWTSDPVCEDSGGGTGGVSIGSGGNTGSGSTGSGGTGGGGYGGGTGTGSGGTGTGSGGSGTGSGLGWVPFEDEVDLNNDGFYDYLNPYTVTSINDSLNNFPCVKALTQQIAGINGNLQNNITKVIKNTFNKNTKFNITYVPRDLNFNSTSFSGVAQVSELSWTLNSALNIWTTPLIGMSIKVKIDTNCMRNCSKIALAQTILHESLHGYFDFRQYGASGNQVLTDSLRKEFGFLMPIGPYSQQDYSDAHHEQIALKYVDNIANALKELFPFTSLADLNPGILPYLSSTFTIDDYYKAIAWGGIKNEKLTGIPLKGWEIFKTNNPQIAQSYSIIMSAEVAASGLNSIPKCN